ncbi:MAG TPA: transporter substrate-binding domain-containing protein [Gammaproteobacteria bacterium]
MHDAFMVFPARAPRLSGYRPGRFWRPIRRSRRRLLPPAALVLLAALPAITTLAAEPETLTLSDPFDIPYTTPTGDGFLDVIAREAFRRIGFNLKFIRIPPERALLNANAGIEDGVSGRIAGLEKDYPNLIPVPERVLNFHFVAFAQQADLPGANWETIASLVVGHIRGWKIFEQNLIPGGQLTVVDTSEQLFDMLNRNRIDVALYERWLGLELANKMGLAKVRVVEPPLAERSMFIYLHKRHTHIVPKLAAALRAIKAEGLYTRVCREKFAHLIGDATQCQTQ